MFKLLHKNKASLLGPQMFQRTLLYQTVINDHVEEKAATLYIFMGTGG